MKKTFTFRSLFTAVVLCLSVSAFAQSPGVWHDYSMPTTYLGQATNLSFVLGGENITADVDYSLTSNIGTDVISPVSGTLSKDDLIANTAKLAFILTADAAIPNQRVITVSFTSKGSDDFEGMILEMYVQTAKPPYANIAAVVADTANIEGGSTINIVGNFVVTHLLPEVVDGDTLLRAWVQDETGSVLLRTWAADVAYKVGDRFDGISGMFGFENENIYLEYEMWSAPAVVKNEAPVPATIDAGDLASYVGRLVKLEKVYFWENDGFSETTPVGGSIQFTAYELSFLPFLGSNLIGAPTPGAYMDICNVTGIVRIVNNNIVISPRSQDDIVIPPSIYTETMGYGKSTYVGTPLKLDFFVEGSHLTGDITLSGKSNDAEAVFEFQHPTLTKDQAETPYGFESSVTVTPKMLGAEYFVIFEHEGDTIAELLLDFIVKDTLPELTFDVENPYGTIYVGDTVEATVFVMGNEYVTKDVILTIPEGSDIVSITPNQLSASSVQTQNGQKVTLTIVPTVASNSRTYFEFNSASGDYTTVCKDVFINKVSAASPVITATAGTLLGSIYVGQEYVKTITVSANKYVTGDITFDNLHADIISITPNKLSAEDAKGAGAQIEVKVKPSAVTTTWTNFTFDICAEGADTIHHSVRCQKVLAVTPAITVTGPGYLFESGKVGEEYTTYVNVSANPFATGVITLSSDDPQVKSLSPATVSVEDAQAAAVKVTVVIIPTIASADEYTGITFTVKADAPGCETATADIKFVVLPNVTTSLNAVTMEVEATKILENGQIYIIKNGIKYNVLGVKVQ